MKYLVRYSFRKRVWPWAIYKNFSSAVEARSARAAKKELRKSFANDGVLVINSVEAL